MRPLRGSLDSVRLSGEAFVRPHRLLVTVQRRRSVSGISVLRVFVRLEVDEHVSELLLLLLERKTEGRCCCLLITLSIVLI